MALVGFMAGWVFALVGALGIVSPVAWNRLNTFLASGLGLWFLMFARLALGVVFVAAAPRSRDPVVFRILGVLTFLAGLAVPLVGFDTFAAAGNVWTIQSTALARAYAAGECAFGLLIAYLIIPREAR